MNEISLEELKRWYSSSVDFQLVDVREIWEQPRLDKDNVLVASFYELDRFMDHISSKKSSKI